MNTIEFLKKHATLPAVLISSCLSAEAPLGIIGGQTGAGPAPYASLIGQAGEQTPINFGIPSGIVNSVAINASGSAALLGGNDSPLTHTQAILYISSYEGGGPLTIPVTPAITAVAATIRSVAINASIYGIIGGSSGSPTLTPYAATVSSSGVATPITLSITAGLIQSVAVNDSGLGIIGGTNTAGPAVAYTALISPSGIASANLLPVSGVTKAVAINASGYGIIAGRAATSGASAAFAALVSPFGDVTPFVINVSSGNNISAAINASNQGIIGGENVTGPGFAVFVSPTGDITPITTGVLLPNGSINGVAINEWGQAIIGGRDGSSGPAFAAFVSPSGGVTPISTGITSGFISSVDINQFNQGLIGGQNGSLLYTAIVSPFGVATRVILVANGQINSVSMTQLPAQIPTADLSGNSLRFADYINEQAPQDVFYFIPAMFDGTLEEALKSAAPTRNAISLYTASNTLFYLNNSLAGHLRNASRFRSRSVSPKPASIALGPVDWKPDELTASISKDKVAQPARTDSSQTKQTRPNTCWLEGLGAWGDHKRQEQTVGFSPTTGAVIFGFDRVINPASWVGVGAAYSHTHVHEDHNAGHSDINQGYLFIYGSYEGSHFYADGALWGGGFHIDQVRNIHMTGFEFKATSRPFGGQLSPHLELGWAHTTRMITFDPFVMVDWVNSWQNRYKETGGGPFKSGQKQHYSSLLRTEIGARFYQTISFNAWRLSFQEKGSYVYKHSFHVGRMNTFLVGSPGTFTVETLSSPQNLGVVEFGIICEPTNERGPYGTISYQGEFGSSFKSNQVSLELAWNF